jgi:hypothetical protein
MRAVLVVVLAAQRGALRVVNDLLDALVHLQSAPMLSTPTVKTIA